MEILELIRSRRSIRVFDTESDVPPEAVDRLLEAARWAPSAGNVQPWRFLVVRDGEVKAALAEAAYGQSFLARAPVIIAVVADPDESERTYRERGRDLYVLQDTAAAVQNILLTAHAMGYGACWVGAFKEDAVAGILNLSGNLRPVALVPLGIPGEEPLPPGRKPLDQVAATL